MASSIDGIWNFRERVSRILDELEDRVRQRFNENNRMISEISGMRKM